MRNGNSWSHGRCGTPSLLLATGPSGTHSVSHSSFPSIFASTHNRCRQLGHFSLPFLLWSQAASANKTPSMVQNQKRKPFDV